MSPSQSFDSQLAIATVSPDMFAMGTGKKETRYFFFDRQSMTIDHECEFFKTSTKKHLFSSAEKNMCLEISGVLYRNGYLIPIYDIIRAPEEPVVIRYEVAVMSECSTIVEGMTLIERRTKNGKTNTQNNHISFPLGGLLDKINITTTQNQHTGCRVVHIKLMFRIVSISSASDFWGKPLHQENTTKIVTAPKIDAILCDHISNLVEMFCTRPMSRPLLPLNILAQSGMDLAVHCKRDLALVSHFRRRHPCLEESGEKLIIFSSTMSSDPRAGQRRGSWKPPIIFGIIVPKDSMSLSCNFKKPPVNQYVCLVCHSIHGSIAELRRKCGPPGYHDIMPVRQIVKMYGYARDIETQKRFMDLFFISEIAMSSSHFHPKVKYIFWHDVDVCILLTLICRKVSFSRLAIVTGNIYCMLFFFLEQTEVSEGVSFQTDMTRGRPFVRGDRIFNKKLRYFHEEQPVKKCPPIVRRPVFERIEFPFDIEKKSRRHHGHEHEYDNVYRCVTPTYESPMPYTPDMFRRKRYWQE